MERKDEDKRELEDRVFFNVRELVLSHIEKLRKSGLDDEQEVYLSVLKSNLNDVISPFSGWLFLKYSDLTPREIQVASLVRRGKTTKEIAASLNSSTRAIEFHRNNLRIKLGLESRKTNLRSYLLSLE
jgi:DNA-binding NarL/FixJ family response regulator